MMPHLRRRARGPQLHPPPLRGPSGRATGLVLGLALATTAPKAEAQPVETKDESAISARLPHVYIDPEFLRRHDPLGTGGGRLLGPAAWPEAIEREGSRLPAPPTGPDAAGAPPPTALAIPREARPDRRTQADAPLTYHALYNPSVAPLRRNVAFDQIGADHTLSIAPGPRVAVPVGPPQPTPGAEVFWGEIAVDLSAGPALVPSVSPAMRLLAVRAEVVGAPASGGVVGAPPEAEPPALRFERDGADNLYVTWADVPERAARSRAARSREGGRGTRGPDGPVKLALLVEADARYFGAPVADQVPLAVQADHPATALPPNLAAHADTVLRALEIDREAGFKPGLDRLVGWFRDFNASAEPPPARGDVYLDLALGKVGVCRHRAFAFFVTARAAGVPTRVVHNEAHAFVEVLAPDGAWRRVDLGGEAPSLTFNANADTRLHRPLEDPFPQPEAWKRQYSGQLAGGGLPGDAELKHAPPPVGTEPDPSGAGAGNPPEGNGGPQPGGAGAGVGTGPGGAGAGPGGVGGPGGSGASPAPAVPLPALPAEAGASTERDLSRDGGVEGDGGPGEEPTGPLPAEVRLDLAALPEAIYRGDALPQPVTGRVETAAGTPAAGVRVQVYLVGADGRGLTASGPGLSGADGRFSLQARVPSTLGPGRYTLVVASGPRRGLGPSRSDVRARAR